MESDFSGYATKAGLKCSDGRTIMSDAFKHQDKTRVPLVWQHGHNDPKNVLGHAILENRPDGVYAYGFFNGTAPAEHAKGLLQHGDINMMSIWANNLIERAGKVLHGAIREVSLVLSGANPGALIENVTIRHSDDNIDILEDEAIIFTGLELIHAKGDGEESDEDDEDDPKEETVEEIYESMTDKQKEVLHYMLGEALEAAAGEAKHDNTGKDNQEGDSMSRNNVFEKDSKKEEKGNIVLNHSDIQSIVADASKVGSLKDAVENYALSHGITNIDVMFPEAKALTNTPEFMQRRTEWVNNLLTGARKSPFSRIKTLTADITVEEARAKGYIKGNMKKEEFFGVAQRVTTPTTIYKKQKLDRDDMVDITDFDVVSYLKSEMRLMLDEELARAILLGDGRDVASEDKISETNIRPIARDHELYTSVINVNIDDANSSVQEIVDEIVGNRHFYKGTGLPTMYTTELYISRFMLLKDSVGRRIYKTLEELATELRVSEIVPVEVMEEYEDIVAVLVNPVDYVIGADKGGNVSMFDDFDIDYNQYKYLMETRVSGALTKLKSAIVVKKVAAEDVLVTPTPPTFDGADIEITDTTGVVYTNAATEAPMTNSGGPYTVPAGESVLVIATAASGYYFASSENKSWMFTNVASS